MAVECDNGRCESRGGKKKRRMLTQCKLQSVKNGAPCQNAMRLYVWWNAGRVSMARMSAPVWQGVVGGWIEKRDV
jgi:hypothetical protein